MFYVYLAQPFGDITGNPLADIAAIYANDGHDKSAC